MAVALFFCVLYIIEIKSIRWSHDIGFYNLQSDLYGRLNTI